jgi:hypothetical protein
MDRDFIQELIQQAIARACPQQAPFRILREAGVVAEIRHSLREALTKDGKGLTQAALIGVSKRKRFNWVPSTQSVERVQLEMKVMPESKYKLRLQSPRDRGVSNEVAPHHDRTDIVVLSSDMVELVCASNGPGDVVSLVNAAHVDVCIEVKASPSVDEGQVMLYGKDIRTLLEFVECRPVQSCAFFVLLDKSSEYFGTWEDSSTQADRKVHWRPCDCLGDLIASDFRTAGANKARQQLNQTGIRLSAIPPEGKPYVEVIRLGETDRIVAWRP